MTLVAGSGPELRALRVRRNSAPVTTGSAEEAMETSKSAVLPTRKSCAETAAPALVSTVIRPLTAPTGTRAISPLVVALTTEAATPLNRTVAGKPRSTPTMRTSVPTAPKAGENPLMTGTGPCTEIGPPNASPPGVTTQTHPEEAPSGTWAVMRRLSTTVKTLAGSRLVPKRTADAPKRLVPLTVNRSPTFTRAGVMAVSCGGA